MLSFLAEVLPGSASELIQKTLNEVSQSHAGVPYFRIYDLRSTDATRLSAGGVADEWVTQLVKMNRVANEMPLDSGTVNLFGTVLVQSIQTRGIGVAVKMESALESIEHFMSGRSAAW